MWPSLCNPSRELRPSSSPPFSHSVPFPQLSLLESSISSRPVNIYLYTHKHRPQLNLSDVSVCLFFTTIRPYPMDRFWWHDTSVPCRATPRRATLCRQSPSFPFSSRHILQFLLFTFPSSSAQGDTRFINALQLLESIHPRTYFFFHFFNLFLNFERTNERRFVEAFLPLLLFISQLVAILKIKLGSLCLSPPSYNVT